MLQNTGQGGPEECCALYIILTVLHSQNYNSECDKHVLEKPLPYSKDIDRQPAKNAILPEVTKTNSCLDRPT